MHTVHLFLWKEKSNQITDKENRIQLGGNCFWEEALIVVNSKFPVAKNHR